MQHCHIYELSQCERDSCLILDVGGGNLKVNRLTSFCVLANFLYVRNYVANYPSIDRTFWMRMLLLFVEIRKQPSIISNLIETYIQHKI